MCQKSAMMEYVKVFLYTSDVSCFSKDGTHATHPAAAVIRLQGPRKKRRFRAVNLVDRHSRAKTRRSSSFGSFAEYVQSMCYDLKQGTGFVRIKPTSIGKGNTERASYLPPAHKHSCQRSVPRKYVFEKESHDGLNRTDTTDRDR